MQSRSPRTNDASCPHRTHRHHVTPREATALVLVSVAIALMAAESVVLGECAPRLQRFATRDPIPERLLFVRQARLRTSMAAPRVLSDAVPERLEALSIQPNNLYNYESGQPFLLTDASGGCQVPGHHTPPCPQSCKDVQPDFERAELVQNPDGSSTGVCWGSSAGRTAMFLPLFPHGQGRRPDGTVYYYDFGPEWLCVSCPSNNPDLHCEPVFITSPPNLFGVRCEGH